MLIIAEMSCNHQKSLSKALEIIAAAAESGANAVKTQTFLPHHLAANLDSLSINDNKLWQGRSLWSLYEQAYMPWEWHVKLMEECEKYNMGYFSTVYDSEAVDFLEQFNLPYYKIASFEVNYPQLLERVAKTNKQIIVSTGCVSLSEIARCVEIIGSSRVTLLKCTSEYPASPSSANLRSLPVLQSTFNCRVGVSDHTKGIGVAIAAVALGAQMVEKHFTLSRKDGSLDAEFSLEPQEFKQMVQSCEEAYAAIQGDSLIDKSSWGVKYKRSIFVVSPVKEGDFLGSSVKVIRGQEGLDPALLPLVQMLRAKIDILPGTPLSMELLK